MPLPTRAGLDAVPAYRQGRSAPAGASKLSSNESPHPPLPSVVRAVRERLEGINRYPDMSAAALRAQLAARYGVDAAEVTVGAGSVEIASQLIHAVAGDGDEVVFAWRSFEAYPSLIRIAGATPVPVPLDVDHAHDLDAMLAAITPRTKAIVPVHYAGASCDLTPLRALAREHGVALIEDAAHAAGTRYQGEPIGQRGTAIFSFHAIKNLTCAEGGMLVTDDATLAERVRRLKFHGLAVDAFDRQTLGRKP